MALAFRQSVKLATTSAAPMTLNLPSAPLPKSALLAAVATTGDVGVAAFRHETAIWNLLLENAGALADELNGVVLRAQIWGAFDIPAVGGQIGIDFADAASSERGVIIAEYTGDVFQFPNPADRVIGDSGTTAGPSTGTIDTGSGADAREAEELLIGAAAADQVVTLSGPGSPFAIRDTVDIGSPAAGTLGLLDAFTVSPITPLRMRVDHSVATALEWVAVTAAIRGVLQVPATPVTTPISGEPVTENDDHEGVAIGHLLEQFQSHDKR